MINATCDWDRVKVLMASMGSNKGIEYVFSRYELHKGFGGDKLFDKTMQDLLKVEIGLLRDN